MAYTAWSVVYGEQPTAAKWNQLGTNDAGFKDGTNIDDLAILNRHLNTDSVTGDKIGSYYAEIQQTPNNSPVNTTVNNLIIQGGWVSKPGSGSGTGNQAVTFPTPFTTLMGLVVSPLCAGSDNSPANLLEFTVAYGSQPPQAYPDDVSLTGFTCEWNRIGGTLGSGNAWGASWLAFGLV